MLAYEIDELVECSQNEAYFILTHFKTPNPFNGISTLKLVPKQLTLLDRIVNKQFIIDSVIERQIGTTTMLTAHALWLALFHSNQRIIFMCPNHNQTSNLRFMVKQAIDELPEFLKPKVITDHKQSLELDNGSWIHYTNGNPDHLRGFNTTCIIADTFDYFKPEWQRDLKRHADHFGLDTEYLLKLSPRKISDEISLP